jgi:hypothetical protein
VLRTALVVICWVRAAASLRIEWRGHPFVLGANTTIVPVTGPADASEQPAADPQAFSG